MKTLWAYAKSPAGAAFLALASIFFGFYSVFIYEKHPGVTLQVVSNANVYDIHANVGNLEIFYAGENLRKSKQTLRLISVRLVNSGQTNITKNDYDEADPLGFEVHQGRILETPVFRGSNAYLQRNLGTTLTSNNRISLKPIILEPGEFIEAQILVLSPEGKVPSVEPYGKVAGVRKINVTLPDDIRTDRPFWDRITEADSLWIQFVRAPLYGLFAIFLIALVVGLGALISTPLTMLRDHRERVLREESIEKFRNDRTPTEFQEKLLEIYESGGSPAIQHLYSTLLKISVRNDLASKVADKIDTAELRKILRSTYPLFESELDVARARGFVQTEGDSIAMNPSSVKDIQEFAGRLGIELTKKGSGSDTLERIMLARESIPD